jgi:hypothetical protein
MKNYRVLNKVRSSFRKRFPYSMDAWNRNQFDVSVPQNSEQRTVNYRETFNEN